MFPFDDVIMSQNIKVMFQLSTLRRYRLLKSFLREDNPSVIIYHKTEALTADDLSMRKIENVFAKWWSFWQGLNTFWSGQLWTWIFQEWWLDMLEFQPGRWQLVWVACRVRYSDVIMNAMAYQITGLSIVYSAVCSGPDQIKHQGSASLAFVKGIHWWPVNSLHKGPVTRKMFPFDDVIMLRFVLSVLYMTGTAWPVSTACWTLEQNTQGNRYQHSKNTGMSTHFNIS